MKQLRTILVALTIVNLFGCAGKENALTADTIANLQDDRLEQAIIDNIRCPSAGNSRTDHNGIERIFFFRVTLYIHVVKISLKVSKRND